MKDLDNATKTELEAAAFRTLIEHLGSRKDVQNIDLMILSGFCRNCLSKWLVAAAEDRGIGLGLEDAREHVYGMPYGEYKEKYQEPVDDEKMARFKASQGASHG